MHLFNCVVLVIAIIPVVYTNCSLKLCNKRAYNCNLREIKDLHNITKHVIPKDYTELKFMNCDFGAFNKDTVNPEVLVHALWMINSVEFIEDEAFSDYKNITFISFTKNNISLLPDFAFQGLSKLITADFSWNQIVKIGEDVFTGASSIRHINLAHNRIELFCIKQVANLQILNLENNLITMLSEFPKIVTKVKLGFNRLTKIKNDTFHNTELLEWLELQWNNITEIESGAFYKTEHLDYADFSFNNLTTLLDVMDGNTLRKLDFTGNQIVEFSGKYRHKHQTFKLILQQNKITSFSSANLDANNTSGPIKLDLSQNAIEKLDKTKFNVNINIKALDLSQNEIESVPVGFFNGSHSNFIKKLNLSTNAIMQLEVGSFLGLASLELLDLSHNRIETLYEAVFLNTPNLQTLNLADNRIRNLNGLEIVRVTRLTLIGLGGNEFSINFINQFKDNKVRVVYNSNREDKNKFANNSDDNLQDL